MQVIADLQLHSRYARAVSQKMVVAEIADWCAKKGIGLVATGDWTHPLWLKELQVNLEEAAPGLYQAKKAPPDSPFFLLSTEVSSIYTQGGRQRRIHTLIFASSFEVVERINNELLRRGANLMSDGRPIIGLSAREVAELVLGIDKNCLIIPAHAWTPWFSLYGSMSGFDSIKECFGELAKEIYAIETGLSSDPTMNWRIKELDNRSIVSFSDAHSPPKLGREATVFEIPEGEKLSYEAIRKAIIQSPGTKQSSPKIAYTIEFYPEEGKYHYTGHRNCEVVQSPEQTKKEGVVCPVCGRRLTVGVMHRVEELSGRELEPVFSLDEYGVRWVKHPKEKRPPFVSLVPLLEILAESLEVGVSTQTTISEYEKLTQILGSEFKVLLKTKPEEIERVSGPRVKEAMMKVRGGDILVDPGFDGVFGKVKIWPEEGKGEKREEKKQMGLFSD